MQKNLRRRARIIGILTFAMTALGFSTQSASAVDFHSCPSGDLCVWLGQNFTQSPNGLVGGAKFSQTNACWCRDPGNNYSTWDNDESWVNNSSGGNSVGVYALVNYTGWLEVCVWPGTTVTNTAGAYKNNGRSNKWKAGLGCYQT
jgi:hypothetical protein